MNYDTFISLAEAYRSIYEPSIEEGRIPWDDTNRPLRSGWTPREKNRAKRISTGVENPEVSPSEKNMERYGKLKTAHDENKNLKVKKKDLHKDKEDYGMGRHNVLALGDVRERMPSDSRKGERGSGLHRAPRNSILSSGKGTHEERLKAVRELGSDKYGAKNDESRDKYYEKGPKGLKEPK